jgi:hypothetical protein
MFGFKQSFIVKGLPEKCKRATLKSLSAGRWVVVGDTKTIGIRQ